MMHHIYGKIGQIWISQEFLFQMSQYTRISVEKIQKLLYRAGSGE